MAPQMRTGHEERLVEIAFDQRILKGILSVPPSASSLVLFAHGSGSGRLSPRNQSVAAALQRGNTATLLFDLLDEEESEDRRKVFDIELLAERLQAAAAWARTQPGVSELPLGYFGASTGAAAALVAASRQGKSIGAVVSRGGRPDLAMEYLPAVQSPTLLIVGGDDDTVLELNRQALEALTCVKRLAVIPGATHLFPEPGALEQVAALASVWFLNHLASWTEL
ncbi:MAG: dienelactone hydrolase family protein [Aureliella sp.]